MPSTLITSPGSAVNVINTGARAGLYWNVGSSATLDTTTSFEGNVLALTSITLDTGATDQCGRGLAHTGAVTMDTNTLSIGCANLLGGRTGTGGTGGTGSGTGLSGGLTCHRVVARPAPLPCEHSGTRYDAPTWLRTCQLLLHDAHEALIVRLHFVILLCPTLFQDLTCWIEADAIGK
jgi:hypothetical protein